MFCIAVGAKCCKNDTLSDCSIQTEFKIMIENVFLLSTDSKVLHK